MQIAPAYSFVPVRPSTTSATAGEPASERTDLVPIPTSGEDILSVNLNPAGEMTASERRRGWGQIGAAAAVKTLNAGLAIGGAVGLGILGSAFLGPVGAVLGAVGGLAGGLSLGAFGENTGLDRFVTGLKNRAARVGAKIGASISKPLQSLFPKGVKEYQLGDSAYRHRISSEEAKGLEDKLQPGDVILTLSDNNPLFHSIVSLEKKPLDFTHVMLYADKGEVIEASSTEGKVRRHSFKDDVEGKAQVVVVRPDYGKGEAQKVIAQADTYLGRSYDWLASLSDKRLGCVEVPYHSFKEVAPEFKVPVTKVWGIRDFIFPSDYLHLSNSKVVASEGFSRPASKMAMARYAWAADNLD